MLRRHHFQKVAGPWRGSTLLKPFLAIAALGILCWIRARTAQHLEASSFTPTAQKDGPLVSGQDFRPLELTPFTGKPWRSEQTLEVVPVVSTSFGVCEIHKVKAEDGSVLDGWLWFDEKDQINVLVRLEAEAGTGAGEGMAGGEEDRKFLVFEQKKYGYQGLSLAPIGGLVEPGEDALMAAKRELLEEAGLDDCHIPREGSVKESIKIVAKSDDREMQRKVYMQEKGLREAVLKGRFKEAKWTQTISMSLLWLMQARLQGRNDS